MKIADDRCVLCDGGRVCVHSYDVCCIFLHSIYFVRNLVSYNYVGVPRYIY